MDIKLTDKKCRFMFWLFVAYAVICVLITLFNAIEGRSWLGWFCCALLCVDISILYSVIRGYINRRSMVVHLRYETDELNKLVREAVEKQVNKNV